ncbi:hypothetical protein H4F17_11155 [Vibrio cholerae]
MSPLLQRAIPATRSPKAQTHLFDIQGDMAGHILSLLHHQDEELVVTYNVRQFDWMPEDKKDWARYSARVHQEIKQLIRKKLALKSNATVEYETLRVGTRFYYFYLATSAESEPANALLDKLLEDGVGLNKVFEILIGLHLKRSLVNQTADFYDLSPAYFNSELYLSARPAGKPNKQGIVYVNALATDLYCSEHQELAFNLNRVSFKTSYSESLLAPVDDTTFLFAGKQGQYQVTERANAIKSKIPYMAFGSNYPLCVNYAEQLVFKTLQAVCKAHGIRFKPRVFQADYELDEFLTLGKTRKLPLVIIDNVGEYPTGPVDCREALYQQLREHLQPAEIMPSANFPDLGSLAWNTAYLVLSKSTKDNGSSIRNLVNGKTYNSFWQALEQAEKGKEEELDYYSQLKIARFRQQAPVVLQGLDIDKLESRSKDKVSGEVTISYKPLNTHMLNKIAIELWLKEQVFTTGRITDVQLPDGHYTAFKIRQTNSKRMFASVIEFEIDDCVLKINSSTRFDNEKRLRHRYSFLNTMVVKKLYNDGFYLWDHHGQVLLSSYTSVRVPRIIGNMEVDTLSSQSEAEGGIGRTSKFEQTVLPYYLAPKARKQEHRIFLQHAEPDLWYFVRETNKPNSTIQKQNLVYNILTYTPNGKLTDPMLQSITDTYLRSFTMNVHKVNEVSKSSLLDKIASLYLGN